MPAPEPPLPPPGAGSATPADPALASPGAAGWVTVPALEAAPGGVSLRCWWEPPAVPRDRAAGILVLPEVFGINGWVRAVARRLAQEGYATLAVPLFARTAPDLELGYAETDLLLGRSHKERTQATELRQDVAAAAAWLQERLGGGRPRLGCVGFCFGGHVAMLAASLPALAVTCDFYGAGVVAGRPGGGPPTLEEVPRTPGRLFCFCGTDDPLLPADDVAAIGAALEEANGRRRRAGATTDPHRLIQLPGGHGFMCEARDAHHPASSTEGWRLMLDLFAESL